MTGGWPMRRDRAYAVALFQQGWLLTGWRAAVRPPEAAHPSRPSSGLQHLCHALKKSSALMEPPEAMGNWSSVWEADFGRVD